MLGITVMCEQSVQEGAEHNALWCANISDQLGRGVAADFRHLGTAHQMDTALRSTISELRDEFFGSDGIGC